jgi:hypothetical protein
MLRQDIAYDLNREFERSKASTEPEDGAQIFLRCFLLPAFHDTCGEGMKCIHHPLRITT